tara:strand:- start:5758 stop:6042 length:285 start_codon:yes stop_codon:yes gene_type:complete
MRIELTTIHHHADRVEMRDQFGKLHAIIEAWIDDEPAHPGVVATMEPRVSVAWKWRPELDSSFKTGNRETQAAGTLADGIRRVRSRRERNVVVS